MVRLTWALIAAAAGLLAAAGARAGAIVDAAFVAEAAKRGAILWDVRSVPEYRKGHIPGAVTIGDAGSVLRDPNTEDFIARDRIEKILGEAGTDLNKEIVVYGNRGSASANFGRYALQYFGAKKAHVFHDGIEGWRAAGQPLSTEDQRLAPVKVALAPHPAVSLTTQEMVARLKNANVQVIDARTTKEYLGEDVRAIRGGHIPGAINIPYEQSWQDPATAAKLARKEVKTRDGMALKGEAERRALYSRLDPEKETVVYCQSFTNITAGSEYFRLASSLSPLYNAGSDMSGSYLVDITGSNRDSTFDIGAFEFLQSYQYGRPSSDVSDGNWLNELQSNTNLYASIDETAANLSDADYIQSGANPVDDTCTFGITGITNPGAGSVTIRVRTRFL